MKIMPISMNSTESKSKNSNKSYSSTIKCSMDTFQNSVNFTSATSEVEETLSSLRKTLSAVGDDGSSYAQKIKNKISACEKKLAELRAKLAPETENAVESVVETTDERAFEHANSWWDNGPYMP